VLRYNSTPNSTPQNPLSQYKAVPQGQQENFCNCYIRSVHRVSYRKIFADVSGKQSAWEQSGKFEGDIVLTEEEIRNGLINPAISWPNNEVPFVTEVVFSEYCSFKIQSGLWGVKGIMHNL
jgi:hypothetical protein